MDLVSVKTLGLGIILQTFHDLIDHHDTTTKKKINVAVASARSSHHAIWVDLTNKASIEYDP